MPQPIPISAASPVEYIPTPQDSHRHRREKTRQIEGMQAALRAAREGPMVDGEEEMRATRIREEIFLMERNIRDMGRRYPQPQTFILAVPTSIERDQINARLIALGLNQVTQDQVRATMIEELFHRDWGKGDQAANEEHAEDLANFLDDCWQRQEAHDAALQRWREQEIERALDEAEGHPPIGAAAKPPRIISVRETAKLRLLIDEMMQSSPKLRDMAAATLDFARRNAVLLARMHIVGIRGFDVGIAVERDPDTRALPEATVDRIREAVDDASWTDLISYIDRMYVLDGAEEKNSDSLPERQSLLAGSPEPSGGTDSSDGSSTISSSGPVPDDESGRITVTSSISTSASDEAPASSAERPIQMDVV